MANRGNDALNAYTLRVRAEKDAQTLTQRCSHCRWTITDTLGVTRPAFLAHLQEHHPEVPTPKPRNRRRRANAPKTIGRSVEENIVLARAQGAAGWVSDE